MFRRNETKQVHAPANTAEQVTLVNRNTVIEGALNAKGRVRIHGRVTGNIIVDGVLEVAEEGIVEGDLVSADEIIIVGRVKANAEAKGKIEIWQTGQLEGDVRARALDIAEGAMFIGRSDMRPKDKAVATLPAAATQGKPTTQPI